MISFSLLMIFLIFPGRKSHDLIDLFHIEAGADDLRQTIVLHLLIRPALRHLKIPGQNPLALCGVPQQPFGKPPVIEN